MTKKANVQIMKSVDVGFYKKATTHGKNFLVLPLLILYLWIHKVLCENALISLKNLCLIAAIPTLFTCFFFWKKGLGDLFRNIFICAFIAIIFLSIWSFILLSINYTPISKDQKIERYAILYYTETRRKNGNSTIYAHIIYREKLLKVKVPYQPLGGITQFNEIMLKTRKGLLGIEIILEKELMKSD